MYFANCAYLTASQASEDINILLTLFYSLHSCNYMLCNLMFICIFLFCRITFMWKFEFQFPNAKLKKYIVLSNLIKLAVISIIQVRQWNFNALIVIINTIWSCNLQLYITDTYYDISAKVLKINGCDLINYCIRLPYAFKIYYIGINSAWICWWKQTVARRARFYFWELH